MSSSRIGLLVLAQSRTNLGHISFSSHYTKQFSLPHHVLTFSHIHPPDRLGRHLVESSPIPVHPAPIPWRFPGHQVAALTTQASNSPLPVNLPPTDPHTGSKRDSHPSSTVCYYTPVPLFSYPQPPPFCKNQLTSSSHNIMILFPIVFSTPIS